jgi:hypothetical protein
MDAKKKTSELFNEFKNFAFKGNVIDLAVGVIIGAAFGKIVDSLVKHIITAGSWRSAQRSCRTGCSSARWLTL